MKCEFYTYNHQPPYLLPAFKAKPVKVNWGSDTGQKIERILQWMSATAVASLSAYKSLQNKDEKYDIETQKDFEEFDAKNLSEDEIINEYKVYLGECYKDTKDPDIMDKHLSLIQDAYSNMDLLKGGYSELTYGELFSDLTNEDILASLGLLGKGNLEAAFNLDIVGFENFCNYVSRFTRTVSRNNLELLKEKINPENSLKYKNLNEDIIKDKKKINQLLGKENQAVRKELLEQIELLKGENGNIPQIKELKKQIQELYKNCENADEIRNLMKNVNEKQRKLKEIVKNKVNLSPQEIINKVWTIAAISQSPNYISGNILIPSEMFIDKLALLDSIGELDEDGNYLIDRLHINQVYDEDISPFAKLKTKKLNKDIKELIELLTEPSAENDKAWKMNINKKIFERGGLKYIDYFADLLDLSNCEYINELMMSDQNFWTYFPVLLYSLETTIDKQHLDINYGLDNFVNNIETKRYFNEMGADYYKWTRYDKNSYISDKIMLRAEDAKNKAVRNMVEDLALLHFVEEIPKKESNKIFEKLKELGVNVRFINHNKDTEVSIDGRKIKFEDLPSIISVIKKEINSNSFWNNEAENDNTEKIRDMLYNHFMHQRKQEIDCAKRLKDSETVDIKVQKVNMADIKHSLCLGNHSHCCTALGSQSNEWSAITYIMNRCISAIEVLANGKSVGNTMMYIAYVNDKLSLVLDDIELQTKFQNNDKIRDMIVEYAKQVCREIRTPDIPIYAGPGMHKVDMSKYELVENAYVLIMGESPKDCGIYLDFDAGQHDIDDSYFTTNLYKIA